MCGCHFLRWDSHGGLYPSGTISAVDTVVAGVGFGLVELRSATQRARAAVGMASGSLHQKDGSIPAIWLNFLMWTTSMLTAWFISCFS